MKRRKTLLIVTAIGEIGTGLVLLVVPGIVLQLLLDISSAQPETILVGRVAGAALVGIGLASWLARNDRSTDSQLGLLVGLLIYDVMAALLLAFAGTVSNMAGFALWPAVLFHVMLGAWCAIDLSRGSIAR